jgi:hypothetical protein
MELHAILQSKAPFMFPSEAYSKDQPVVSGTHMHNYCIFNGWDLLTTYNWVECLKQEEDSVKKPPKLYAETTLKTEELACSMLSHTLEMIWCTVKAWCDNKRVMWH